MYLVMVLLGALSALSLFILTIVWLGGGFKTDITGGPLLRERARKGIVRIPIHADPSEVDEWGSDWMTMQR